MSSVKLYSEIFEDFELAPSRADKIEVLRKNDHPRFRDFLAIAFNDNFKFDVIVPPYRPAPEPAGNQRGQTQLAGPRHGRIPHGALRRAGLEIHLAAGGRHWRRWH